MSIIAVSGTTDQSLLQRIAQNAFEQIGRQEIEGVLNTDDVSSYGRDISDVDLLECQVGDPIELLIAQGTPHIQANPDEPNTSLA